MFINRVIEDLENAVVQSALIGVADVHPGAFPHCLKTFKFINLGGIIFLALTDASGVVLSFLIIRILVFLNA